MDEYPTIRNVSAQQSFGPESYLGTSSKRYFSDGYKDIQHDFDNIRIEEEKLCANLVLKWPEKWSEKKGISITPHIGTLDFFLASTILVEQYFQAMDKEFVKIISKMWIAEFTCRTGNKCLEQQSTPCVCRLLSTKEINGKIHYSFEVLISTTTVCIKIISPYNSTSTSFASIFAIQTNSYYFDQYKNAERRISDINVQVSKKSISARYELIHTRNSSFYGLGSSYMPCLTFCDLVLSAGQLTQILLYNMDNTSREESSNLWMRKIHCIYNKPITTDTQMSVFVNKTNMVKMKTGIYNCSDLTFDFSNGDLIAHCSSAYQPHLL
jgi:Pseudomonas avirulence D protein (AvrD).